MPVPMTERYIWNVTYQDGTTFHEYPDPDTHRSFNDVRVGDVVRLDLVPNAWLGMTGPVYTVACSPEDDIRPVMFRTVAINTLTGETARWHVIGWQKTVNGRNAKSLTYIPDSGEGPIVIADRALEVGP